MVQKGKHISLKDTVVDCVKNGGSAGTKFTADGDATIKADGKLITDSTTALNNAEVAVADALTTYEAALLVRDDAKIVMVDDYNLGVDDANRIYPNNTVKITNLGLFLTKEPEKAKLCTDAKNGEALQSPFPGFTDLEWDKVIGATRYTMIETTGDPSDMALYYPTTPVDSKTTKVTVRPAKLNVVTWFRIIAHNAAGSGPPSEPFGGIFH